MEEETIRALVKIGLTNLESVVYLHLCREPAATGYAVAQAVGKPVPNVYKALESLRNKGVVVCDETTSRRRYTSIPMEGYFKKLEKQLLENRIEAEKHLSKTRPSPVYGGVFRLDHADHVYERAREMAADAECVFLADACPPQVEILRESLEAAATSGTEVFLKSYGEVDLPSCHVVTSQSFASPHDSWPVDWLHCCADGRQHLTALFARKDGRLVHALWSKETFLSGVAHNGLLAELMLTEMVQRLESGASTEDSMSVLDRFDTARTGKLIPLRALISSFLSVSGGPEDADG